MNADFLRICALMVCCAVPAFAQEKQPYEFHDGDRIVFLGGGLFERDLRYGYIETFLTARLNNLNLTFRNLSWSGDTVFGDARAGFDTAVEGYQRLIKHVQDARPTVIFLYYGQNEAFEGEAGLSKFKDGLIRLLDDLDKTGARIVVLSPTLLENLGPPLPDPAKQNANMQLYANTLQQVAKTRHYRFVNLTQSLRHPAEELTTPFTDDGLHYTAYGYWKVSQLILRELGYKIVAGQANGVSELELSSDVFFTPRLPEDAPRAARDGEKWQQFIFPLKDAPQSPVRIDLVADNKVVASAMSDQWMKGVTLDRIPEVQQVEELREAIVAKNRLFFNQWRPQNETYIFGFRKHEQGQYAAEIPQFDPLIEKAEQRIAELKKPKSHVYRFAVEGGK